jgi:UTP--glucose-1-phosphate uridylyltransferase
MRKVDEAIILAGGRGTRMLPATLYSAKEFLPLYDMPIIKHLFEECIIAGIKKVHLVLSPRKKSIFDALMFHGNEPFEENVRSDLDRSYLRLVPEGMNLSIHVQDSPGGVADAMSVALDDIEGDFLVLLGDNVLLQRDIEGSGNITANTASLRMVEDFASNGVPCAGVISVGSDIASLYGIAEVVGGNVVSIVEKPGKNDYRGDLALCGRYLFPKDSSSILEGFSVEEYGELQSIAFMLGLSKTHGLRAIDLSDHSWYDSGNPSSWVLDQFKHLKIRRSGA